MKLASLNEGRDGALVVVSADLTKAVRADRVARTLQSALDNWAAVEPELQPPFRATGIRRDSGRD